MLRGIHTSYNSDLNNTSYAYISSIESGYLEPNTFSEGYNHHDMQERKG